MFAMNYLSMTYLVCNPFVHLNKLRGLYLPNKFKMFEYGLVSSVEVILENP